MRFGNFNLFLFLAGALISGFSVFFILSYLLIPSRITFPISIIISVLIFGLTKYYSVNEQGNAKKRNNPQRIEKGSNYSSIKNIVFIIVYMVLLAVLVNSSSTANSELFINWDQMTLSNLLDLFAAIAFSFFLPGYALVTILNKKYKLTLLPKLLLAYLFSILITGLAGYISGSLGYAISNTSIFLIASYILIFLISLSRFNVLSRGFYHFESPLLFYRPLYEVWTSVRNNYSQYIVFSSLFALVILYTYYLNNGEIIVDQWYHHGRAILIGSGLFRDLAVADVSELNPPFFSASLASFFNLSGSPSVNTYVAIDFLNIVPVFAFYYFFMNWIPKDKKRAALLATTLFMLSSGFGWVYAINSVCNCSSTGNI